MGRVRVSASCPVRIAYHCGHDHVPGAAVSPDADRGAATPDAADAPKDGL